MKRILLLTTTFLMAGTALMAQKPPLEIKRGKADTVYASPHTLVGVTAADATITVAGQPAKVYKTGAFGAEVRLQPGKNTIPVKATGKNGNVTEEMLTIILAERARETATTRFFIESIQLTPSANNLVLSEGDVLQVKAKALPGQKLTWLNGQPLFEMPADEYGLAGIYQGQYTVKANDPNLSGRVRVEITDGNGHSGELVTDTRVTVLDPQRPKMIRTKGETAYLNYGLGEDRLGGAKIGTIAEGIRMQVLQKIDNVYKVRLSDNHSAYLPAAFAQELPEGYFVPQSLTGSWSVAPREKSDRIVISLADRLPYTTWQEINPSRIVVQVYGAVCNSNWITQYPDLKAVKNVDFRQIEPDVFRVTIDLKNDQHWGHKITYSGNSLVIEVKASPGKSLQGMVIGVDAGHGGPNNRGAVSVTGINEKDINLRMASLFKEEMEKRGARVVLSRPVDQDVRMDDRKKIFQDANVDLMVSFHNNAGGSPLRTRGTSTYYRHIGFKPLTTAILDRLLELDNVENFGNIGNFNFSLSAPIEFPNVLVEGLFMSNLADEEMLADDQFIRQLVDKVVIGLEEFLRDQQ